MIEAGIDVLEVVQTSARDMDLETMYRLYGQDISFSGGIDVQQLLVFGTPAHVCDEARRARDLWGERGDLLLGPSHEMVPETPIEKRPCNVPARGLSLARLPRIGRAPRQPRKR